ncbi:hypothetical protein HNR42_002486 [Deinobacterium chartae]|uniref:Uncharacterized protein n=1 Tax=Deinobacterium chartae TaxID=521158 RepID=A0A841I3Q8_9DEIO|nr:hypothetical protein [Deinobacterium chartae]MBB6099050.1 hypothetical protein [Deinobacterium chartae]
MPAVQLDIWLVVAAAGSAIGLVLLLGHWLRLRATPPSQSRRRRRRRRRPRAGGTGWDTLNHRWEPNDHLDVPFSAADGGSRSD